MYELLSTKMMVLAESGAIAAGVSVADLMENAGRVVAGVIIENFVPQPVIVLCGSGNNGGDGWVCARYLAKAGFAVTIATSTPRETLSGSPALMAKKWQGGVVSLDSNCFSGYGLLVDAFLGSGLSRPLSAEIAEIFKAIPKHIKRVAIDMPSGVCGNTGQADDNALRVDITVTFLRKKIGHVLFPGRSYCGKIYVTDIGITDNFIDSQNLCWENDPSLWFNNWPEIDYRSHKYQRGHCTVIAGPAWSTGAARLSAMAALRIGSGLVTTIGLNEASVNMLAQHQTAIMTAILEVPAMLGDWLQKRRSNCVVLGPGIMGNNSNITGFDIRRRRFNRFV